MKTTLRTIALLTAVLLLATMFSACNGTTQPQPTTPTEIARVINVGIAQDLDDVVDPQRTISAATRQVLFNVYEGLVKPASDGSLIPAVASSYDVDGNVFTFTLRDGIKFHDGTDVTVQDVVFSVSRAAGLYEGEPLEPALAVIESVEATDDKTIVITVGAPNLELLAYLATSIIPENFDGSGPPPGTGPFMYISRTPQENFIIERFDDYWGEKAAIDRVVYRIIENPETLVMSLQSGTIDVCPQLTYDQAMQVGDAFETISSSMKLVQAVYLNNAVAPFDNVEVRRALAHAINRQEIMDIMADGYGFPLGSSIYPSFAKYFVPELVDMYEYDPAKARTLLADAGYPDGFSFEITVPAPYTPHVDTATVVISQLAEIGVTATLRLIEWNTWLTDVYGGRDFEATVIGFDASAMTARALLERWQSEKSGNMINFNNPDYDRVLAQALAATDEAEQTALYKQLQEILATECANLYIQDLCDFIAIRKDILGYTPYPIFVIDMAKLYID